MCIQTEKNGTANQISGVLNQYVNMSRYEC